MGAAYYSRFLSLGVFRYVPISQVNLRAPEWGDAARRRKAKFNVKNRVKGSNDAAPEAIQGVANNLPTSH